MNHPSQPLCSILLLSNTPVSASPAAGAASSTDKSSPSGNADNATPSSSVNPSPQQSRPVGAQETFKAGYLTFHPERKAFLPLFHPLHSIAWKGIRNLVDFGLICLKVDIYLLGGYDSKLKKVKRDVWRYDLREGRWFFCTKLLEHRFGFTPFVYDNKVFCAGGWSKDKKLLSSVEYYEPMMNVCYYDQALPTACAQYGAGSSNRGEAFIIGGIVQTPSGVYTTSKQFLMLSKRRTVKGGEAGVIEMEWISLPGAKYPAKKGICRLECAFCPKTDRIYCVGGVESFDLNATPLSMIQFYGFYYVDMNDIRSVMRESPGESAGTNSIWKTRPIPQCERTGCTVMIIGIKRKKYCALPGEKKNWWKELNL